MKNKERYKYELWLILYIILVNDYKEINRIEVNLLDFLPKGVNKVT